MPILPSHEQSPPSAMQSPSDKHNDNSPFASTASTPSSSPSPTPTVTHPLHVIDTSFVILPYDENKSMDEPAMSLSPLSSSSADSADSTSPSFVPLAVTSAPLASTGPPPLPMSPIPSSYAAYPPPLHPSMIGVTVMSPPPVVGELPPLPPLPQTQLPMLHEGAIVNTTDPTTAVSTSPLAPSPADSSSAPSVAVAPTAPTVPAAPADTSAQPTSAGTTFTPTQSSTTTTTTSNTDTPITTSAQGHNFSPHFSMFTCVLNPTLSVTCFRRGGPDGQRLGPLFVVREFDAKVIRSSPKLARPHATTATGEPSATSEQAFRASIRQAMLNMNLRPENASKSEIRVLKAQGILGKRAPSASLLTAEDMMRLLIAFHKEECAKELRDATCNWKEVEAQWLANQNRSQPLPGTAGAAGTAGTAAVEPVTDATAAANSTAPANNAFTHVPLTADNGGGSDTPAEGTPAPAAADNKAGLSTIPTTTTTTPAPAPSDPPKVVVPHIIKVGEGIDEDSMAIDRGPKQTKAELKEQRERDKQLKKDEKAKEKETKRLEREAKKLQADREKEERKLEKLQKAQRKRKADASPMLSPAPTAGLEALLSAVEDYGDGSASVVRGSSSMPNVIRALSTPPSVDGRSELMAAGLSFRLPSSAVHSAGQSMKGSSPLYAPQPRRPQTPVGFTSTLTSTSPSPTSVSPTSTTSSTSAFSSPITQPRPLIPHTLLERQHSGSTSPTGSDADKDERLALSRVFSTDSEAERETTRMKLDGFGLAQMDEGKEGLGAMGSVAMDEDKGATGGGMKTELVDKEMSPML